MTLSPDRKSRRASAPAETDSAVPDQCSLASGAPLPPNEPDRLSALERYQVLDTPPEQDFDDLTMLAAHICQTPIALISLVDRQRQWFKSRVGLNAPETPRELAFCAHALLQEDLLIVPDARQDPRFQQNPLVTGEPHIRFYAGAPLITPDGYVLGTLCVIDREPRTLQPEQANALRALSRQVVQQLETRRQMRQLEEAAAERSRVLEALDASEERYARATANIPGMVFQCIRSRDGQMEFTHISGGVHELLGVAPDALMQTPGLFESLLHPDDSENLKRTLSEAARELSPWIWEGRAQLASGEVRWLSGTARPQAQGGDVLFDGLLMDITDRKQTAENLLLLKFALEQTTTGIVIADARRPDCPLSYVNRAFEQITGYSASEALGRNCRFLQGRGTDPQAVTAIREAIAAGRECEMVLKNYRKDGTPFWNELRISPVRDRFGRLTHFVGLQNDITERKRAEKAQNRLARYNQLLLECTAEGIYGMDLEGRLTFINPSAARVLGLDGQNVLGQSAHAVMHHSRPDGTPYPVEECPIFRTLKTGQICRLEDDVFWRRDGSSIPVECVAAPIVEDGVVEGAVVAFSDITDRKQAEQELQEAKELAEVANQAKSQFLANMSHELRTPLNAVIGYSEMLQEDAQDLGYEQLLPDLQKINAAGKHLLSLINDVLDLSKIEAGKMTVYHETFDIGELMREVASTVEPLVQSNHNELTLVVPESLGTMHCDLTKVKQSLYNLLSNAAKFTDHGQIAFSAQRCQAEDREMIIFSVTDTGIGISDEQLTRLFQPFSQADHSTTRKFGGTGLGLALTKRFCELLEGDLTVRSELGQGSTFMIQLPALPSSVLGAASEALGQCRDLTGVPIALIIDDDPAVRDLLARFFRRHGMHPLVASNGEEGLALARTTKPDLITLDVVMPRLDGWATLAALKADPKLEDIPVIMLTIVGDKGQGYSLGAAEYLTKPIDHKRLTNVLGKLGLPNFPRDVLVVDDDPLTRDNLRALLTQHGAQTREAPNGRVALDEVRRQMPQLLLLDLMMPEMDGFEFLSEFRQLPESATVPVVVLTAKDLTPEQRGQLNGTVERVCEKSRLNRDALLGELWRVVASFQRQLESSPRSVETTPSADTSRTELSSP